MSRKQFLDTDVYTEAKKRIRHTIESFDSVLVAFSGGKDSLCTLHLVKEVYDEMGIKEKVKVFFRDEELIPDDVVNFVTGIAESGEYDFRYYAIPLKSQKFILGKTYEYIQWDPERKWMREPPAYAIRDDSQVFSQYDADEYICANEKGRVAIFTGIRASESLMRFQACYNKRNENYINATKSKRIKVVKPIYDWDEKDVFLYFYKTGTKYCAIYDNQVVNGDALRVSTPLHAEASKKFYKLKTLYPKFYQQLIDLFPEMIVQGMYWREFDKDKVSSKYEHTFNGIRDYINENITDKSQRELALKRVHDCELTRTNKGKNSKNYGGYPVLYVFKAICNGQYKRAIHPRAVPSQEEIDYEIQ